ncbi:AAA family ATPase [Staphylospora marina]|uniref:AAA family ATPase n=1 Tax=Staphylospora marina TaxID=2490858 RepID=UPI000F5BF90D|nr:AAA family ATPase [Staphylospora marina]
MNETDWKEEWESARELTEHLRREIGRVIIGQDDVVEQVLIAMLADGHVLLEGVPGLGKTLLIKTIARLLDLSFSRIQFTPDLMPADILGTTVISADESGRTEFRFQQGPVFAHLVLADEINRATPKTQSALLEAMQERTVTVSGKTRNLPEPFFVLATQNPLEMEGTHVLPEAQLDRFLLKIKVPFPKEEELRRIVSETVVRTERPTVTPLADARRWMWLRGITEQLLVPDEVVEEAVRLVLMTHPDHPEAPEPIRKYVRAGAGPRGAQALVRAARAMALLRGRHNAGREDLTQLALPVLRHRVLRTFEAEALGISEDELVTAVLEHRKREANAR